MSLFATHTAWFDPSVPQDVVAQFTANGGHVTDSPTSPSTQLLFSLSPPTQPAALPSPTSPPPPLLFHPQWGAASVAAGALQPLSAHLLPPAAYAASANAVELHLQVAGRMGEEWRKGQAERGKAKKRARGGRQQKKVKVVQEDEVSDEVMEMEPPQQPRRRRRVSGAQTEQAAGADGSDERAEGKEDPSARRSKRKQPTSKREAANDVEAIDGSNKRWPDIEDAQSTTRQRKSAAAGRLVQRKSAKPDVSAFGGFSSWFADPFAPQQPLSPPQRAAQSDGDEAPADDHTAASDDEWEVEAVVDRRADRRGEVEYRLKWSRADGRRIAEDDSYAWVKASDCSCDELIAAFERRREAQQQDVDEEDERLTQRNSRLGRRTKPQEEEKEENEQSEGGLLHDDVAAAAAMSFGGWLTEPNFDSILAELQHTAPSSAVKPAQRGKRLTERKERTAVNEEKQQEKEEEKFSQTSSRAYRGGRAASASRSPARPAQRDRRAASASRSPMRPSRAEADKSRQAIAAMLNDFPLDADTPTHRGRHSSVATGAANEVQELTIHEESVSGVGDARTLTVKHTVLRRSPARLTSLLPFPAVTSGRQLFFPRGLSPARVELHEDERKQPPPQRMDELKEEAEEGDGEEEEGREDEEGMEEENVVDLDGQLMPCEKCGEGIRADEYEAHARRCRGGAARNRPRRTPR